MRAFSRSGLIRCLILASVSTTVSVPVSAPAQSVLTVDFGGPDAIVLRWPAATPANVLEASGALGPAASWQTVAAEPSLANGRYSLTVNATDGAPRFYRLRQTAGTFTTVVGSSPAQDETGVAVTRESILRLSSP